MYVEYFYWQFIAAPWWLTRLSWNMQRALFRYFSVAVMVRTLFAHWHKDAVPYQGGSIAQYALTFAWNLISRLIGFIIRAVVVLMWMAVEMVFIVLAAAVLTLFLLWPLLVLIGLVGGAVLILA